MNYKHHAILLDFVMQIANHEWCANVGVIGEAERILNEIREDESHEE